MGVTSCREAHSWWWQSLCLCRQMSSVFWPTCVAAEWCCGCVLLMFCFLNCRLCPQLQHYLFLRSGHCVMTVWGSEWGQKKCFRSSVKWPRRRLYLADGVSYEFSSVLLGSLPWLMTPRIFGQPLPCSIYTLVLELHFLRLSRGKLILNGFREVWWAWLCSCQNCGFL